METDFSKHMHFQWKIKGWLEHWGALGIMGGVVPLMCQTVIVGCDLQQGETNQEPH